MNVKIIDEHKIMKVKTIDELNRKMGELKEKYGFVKIMLSDDNGSDTEGIWAVPSCESAKSGNGIYYLSNQPVCWGFWGIPVYVENGHAKRSDTSNIPKLKKEADGIWKVVRKEMEKEQ